MIAPQIEDYKGKTIHMIGIGGSSMSGLAKMLLELGYKVQGSDNAQSHTTDELKTLAIPVSIGHIKNNISGADFVVYSAAISNENPEIIEAKALHLPMIERAELLGQLMKNYPQSVAISGTHGKTSVTGMLAQALIESNLDPTVHIGGKLDFIGGSTHIGNNELFIAEACEFNGSFLHMHPTTALVLNIEEDHLDYYKDLKAIEEAFFDFISLLPQSGLVIGNGDDQKVTALLTKANRKSSRFGLEATNDFYPANLQYNTLGMGSFTLMHQNQSLGEVHLSVPGAFNVLNALAALSAAYHLGAEMALATKALSHFLGVHRRFERTGEVDGVVLYHDYAHNPTEMRNVLSVAKMQPHNRLWAVMQPHTYSRVKRLFNDYLTCTSAADFTLVTDIYAAREKDPGDIHAAMLVEGMKAKGVNAHLTPTFNDTEAYLRANWQPGDLVITMSCGNINMLNEQIQNNGDSL